MASEKQGRARRTQAERRAESRSALLQAAARRLSAYGYANLSLERVAREAGYSRGALYHQFADKEELALAVVEWTAQTWDAEVGHLLTDGTDPVEALLAVARGHAVYCRRDTAGVLLALRVEFTAHDHPVGRAIAAVVDRLLADCARLVTTARESGAIPPGPPPRDIADAVLSALESVGIAVAGHAPHDTELTERAVRGLLGLAPRAVPEGIILAPDTFE